jgi:hypothetical protein
VTFGPGYFLAPSRTIAEEVVVMTRAELTHRPKAVFVSDFIDMSLSFEELAALVLDGIVFAGGPTPPADRAGSVLAGPPRVHDESVIVPITWELMSSEPAAHARLLSTIEADLRLTSLGGHGSRAALSGRYHVASACSAQELMVAHGIAASRLRSFLEHLEATLREQRSTPPGFKAIRVGPTHRTSRAGML